MPVRNVTAVPTAPARPVRPMPVDVVLGIERNVVVDDVRYALYVESPLRDVRGNQDTDLTGREPVQRPRTMSHLPIRVHRVDRDARALELGL